MQAQSICKREAAVYTAQHHISTPRPHHLPPETHPRPLWTERQTTALPFLRLRHISFTTNQNHLHTYTSHHINIFFTMAETHTYKFNVSMSCSGCSGAIDRVLKKLDGKSCPSASQPDSLQCSPIRCT